MQGERYISRSKIKIYEQHREDLSNLKRLIKKYVPVKYNEMFRLQDNGKTKKVNYEAYAGGNSGNQEEFCKYAKSLLKGVVPEEKDAAVFENVMSRLDKFNLCPRQVNSDNRVIPYQVYRVELKAILDNASKYLHFLNEKSDGITVSEKILSIFEFRVPYFVGPLCKSSQNAWLVRRAEGPIYPWNFDDKVDIEQSELAFIDKMTNTCTYLPYAEVLPKMSLCYEKFQMLNELNAISVNGRRVPVEAKQRIFNELCLAHKKITKKSIKDFLLCNKYYSADELDTLSGIDDNIKSSLSSHIAFKQLLSGQLDEKDVEEIIKRRTYTESRARFALWLNREYANLSEDDRKYICTLKFNNFGRLSRELLCELNGTESNSETGEAFTILELMWNENVTLQEVLSSNYTYGAQIKEICADYFAGNKKTIDERLDSMYISNSVKRPIIRALDIVTDIVKANGKAPEKIFIEMARGGSPEEKGKRKDSRYKQIIDRYKKCNDEDTRQLSEELAAIGSAAESRVQGERLFLYYMQLGKCMYTGERIELSQLSSELYDIDHIYPRSKVKDDSIINKVLVNSSVNGDKGETYPIKPEIRKKMAAWWKYLKESDFITGEKYKRLTRTKPFSDDEQWGFINRQLVETRQSTKAIASILDELYPETKIVYVKAGLVSEFRQEFDMLKSRAVNDLHHGKDAYLNIVVGNVYNEKFTKQWFLSLHDKSKYNIKIKTLFSHKVKNINGKIVWNGAEDVGRVKNIIHKKNVMHLTRYAFCRKGGLFDQQPVSAKEDLFPLKKGLPTEKYGGYNSTTASFFMLVKYSTGKKTDLMLMPVELLFADKVESDVEYATNYAKNTISSIIGKEVLFVSFPLGMRKIKIGTVFEFDGIFRAYITAKKNNSTRVSLSVFSPLAVGYEWEKYIKRVERFVEKKKENPNIVYSEEHDEITAQKNMELYELLILKLKKRVYDKRPTNPVKILEKGKEAFEKLDIFEQAKCLLQIIIVFSRINNGCNFSNIGGAPNAAELTLSSSLSNWKGSRNKKLYTDVRILDMTASGLYQSKTGNLLELL